VCVFAALKKIFLALVRVTNRKKHCRGGAIMATPIRGRPRQAHLNVKSTKKKRRGTIDNRFQRIRRETHTGATFYDGPETVNALRLVLEHYPKVLLRIVAAYLEWRVPFIDPQLPVSSSNDTSMLCGRHAIAFTKWLDAESRRGLHRRGAHVAVQAAPLLGRGRGRLELAYRCGMPTEGSAESHFSFVGNYGTFLVAAHVKDRNHVVGMLVTTRDGAPNTLHWMFGGTFMDDETRPTLFASSCRSS
jgi:hypothetical protein